MPSDEARPDEIPPAPRFYPVEHPVPPDFHPDLGYLCPSASLVRNLRNGAITALAGLAMAASVTLAFAPSAPADNGGPDEAAMPALSAAVPVETATPAPAVAGTPALPPRREIAAVAAAARAQVDCDDFLASFLAVRCREVVGRTGTTRSARTARVHAHKLAMVAIGRTEGESDPRKAGPATAPSGGATTAADAAGGAPKTVATAAAATDAAAPAKPRAPVRTVHKDRRPSQDTRLDSATAMVRGGNWGGGWGGNWGSNPGGNWGGNSGGGSPHGGAMPSRSGSANWARSW
jgi:hypothetical protein